MIKVILNLKKEKRGNITILILIMGFAVILLTTAMVGYIFRDINYVELDRKKLRALNIAEAGISNMFLNIEKHYTEEDVTLPSSPYTGEIIDNGNSEGTFTVEYDSQSDGDLTIYNVTSTGVDKDGMERMVRVKINVLNPGPALDIYDYVYTATSATTSGDFKTVDGPFYTDGDLNITAGSGISQDQSEGPIIVKGDLYISGDAVSVKQESLSVGGNVVMGGSGKILGGQVNIAGSLTMSGGTYIDEGLVSPMIVMGDIDMSSGSPRIGESGEDLILSCNGTINPWPPNSWAPIYATRDDSLTYTFVDPQYDVSSLIDEYYSEVQDSADPINGNLTLSDENVPYNYEDTYGNSLSFEKEGDDYVLEINGNIIVDGNLQIGIEDWWIPELSGPSTNEIYYRGKGIIYTTGNIKTVTTLWPDPLEDFPESTLLVLVSNGTIESYVWREYDYIVASNINDQPPLMYMVGIAKGNIKIAGGGGNAAIVKGTLITGGLLDADYYNAKIYYQQGIKDSLPPELPSSDPGGGEIVITRAEWQEAIN